MTTTAEMPTGEVTYPATEWVRTITFYDDPRPNDSVPVHVTAGILVNDKPLAVRVPRDHEWSIIGGFQREVVVSLVLHEDDVQMGRIDADGNHQPATIAGLRCLTPVDPALLWARLNAYRAEHSYPLHPETGRGSHYPTDSQGTYGWVRVFIQVREVKVIALPE